MGGLRPTGEQREALRKFRTGRSVKISAFAGTGKTATLAMLASSRRERGLYLAFNRAIAAEAAERFPQTVECRTTHALAWRDVQAAHPFSNDKMRGSLQPRQLSELLGLKSRRFGSALELNGVQQAHLLLRTLQAFCQSDAQRVRRKHIPQYGRLVGLPRATLDEVHAWVRAESKRLWAQMIDPHSEVPLGHDGYLKLWALGRPRLPFEYVLLDEAQDTNPVILDVLREQEAQIVYVGDRHQQIYEWRGAVNAMEEIEGCEEAWLTESFRFGPELAEVASAVLGTLGERRRLTGNRALDSRIVSDEDARTVLARTNATLVAEALEASRRELRPHVVGGVGDLQRLVSDVFELKNGDPGSCPELFGFGSWEEVVEFAEDEEGEHLQTFVKLVHQHGERKLWAAISDIVEDESEADVLLSTAHKAKGREWDEVRLAPDFWSRRLSPGHPDAEAEVRLFYVAMTRARRVLSVDPDMLEAFTEGSWRTRPRKRRPRARAAPPTLWQRLAQWWSAE
jgi:hypothetical protein